MNREIKFRAWDKENKVMIYPKTQNKWLGKECEFYPIVIPRNKLTHSHHLELMQFTGLEDKNGIEIFEGDIVVDTNKADVKLYGTRKGVIAWDEDEAEFMVSIKGIQSESFYDYDGRNFIWQALEVIGNIYENPEPINQ